MPNYRRPHIPGGTFFLTLVTHERRRLFADPRKIDAFRQALWDIKCEKPFNVAAAVVLPDHIHFIWALPAADTDLSMRVGRLKAAVTRDLGAVPTGTETSASRRKRREGNLWQRRFWEHAIRDETDLRRHMDYIHYNPVKHGLASCPHAWPYSSFRKWARRGLYETSWACICGGAAALQPPFGDLDRTGE